MNLHRSKVLVTGCAGFIGMHTVLRLLQKGALVHGIDNLNGYYSPELKRQRLLQLGIDCYGLTDKMDLQSSTRSGFSFRYLDIEDKDVVETVFSENRFDYVVHLAAQAGVRYSIDNPRAYIKSNIAGFLNILEASRLYDVQHLVYASSSSVYGLTYDIPFEESQNTDTPASLYAATKKSNELMAHVYSHLYNLPTTGLRLFTVYGPWGRPDMAMFRFTQNILHDQPVEIFGDGHLLRDFTYVDDVAECIVRIVPKPSPDINVPFRVFNVGNDCPISVAQCVATLEEALNKKAYKVFKAMHKTDVYATHADITRLKSAIEYIPHTPFEEGARRFVEWYRQYYLPVNVPVLAESH